MSTAVDTVGTRRIRRGLGTAALGVTLAFVASVPPANGQTETRRERWRETLERASDAVVTLRVTMPRSFDDQGAGYQTATGFVVDAERGLLLTNRHVVTPGPIVAEAVFRNNEALDVEVVYRDPVHDFGVLRFDPRELRFMPVVQLALAPEAARVGAEIRVIGNDAGEKLSILAGTLARLDREAPPYGSTVYNDFNTFYYQAASGTSGGSSGSPVIDVEGRVIALNAGASRRAASSFFLPLDRVVRALELVQREAPVTRGTLQTVFRHRPYDELRRLGLRESTERQVRERFPEGTGLLVVDEVLPGGPADGQLAPGDVLLRVDGLPLQSFVPLEQILDGRVATPVEVQIERGGEPLTLALQVGDLHAITPSAYVEAGGGVFNPLSYQMARNFGVPVGGVYAAEAGYALSRAGLRKGSVITRIGDRPTRTLADFEAAWSAHADGARVPIEYFRLENPRSPQVAVLDIEHEWFPMQRCGESFGRWSCIASPDAPAPREAPVREASLPSFRDPVTRRLAPSLVTVELEIPYPVDGVHGTRFLGAGLVVDAERGLVVVDRETVPIALGDLTIRFAGAVRLEGELVYLHPEHNLAVVRYSPDRLGSTAVQSAELLPGALGIGDEVWLVGLSARERPVSQRTTVSRLEPLDLPLLRTPRFREANLEVLSVADAIPTIGGVLADRRGRVVGLWASFSRGSGKNLETFVRGIPIERVEEITRSLREGRPVQWRSLGVEWAALPLSEARDLGLPEDLAQRLAEVGGERPQVLSVARRAAGSPGWAAFEVGDLLLEVEGRPAVRFSDVERAAQQPSVDVRLLRRGQLVAGSVETQELSGRGTERAVVWAGAVLQEPPRALAIQRGIEPGGVYVSFYFYGSPANRYRLSPTRRILSVDGRPTPDLDSLLRAVAGKRDRDSVRLQAVDLEGKVQAITLELDLRYWPTYELQRTEVGWRRLPVVEVPAAGASSPPAASVLTLPGGSPEGRTANAAAP